MKIFISWSGERSQALALAVKDWLQPVLHFAQPWLSTSDIKSGDRWGIEIAKELQDTNFGILCVTSDNLNAPWLLFEAGALAKSIDDGRVVPLLLDLEKSDLSGPLTQFQAEKVDFDGVRKLAESLNKAAANPIPQETFTTLFDALWPKLEESMSKIPASGKAPKKLRPESEVLEELVAGVRSVEMRVRDVLEDGPEVRLRRKRRFHPGMLMDMTHRMMEGPDDPIQLLIIASFLRDDAPWFYEIAQEAYRAIRSGDRIASKVAIRRYRDAAEMLSMGPYSEFFGDSKMSHMMLRDILEFMPSFEGVDISPATKSSHGKKAAL